MVSTLQCPPYARSTSQLQYLIGGLRERIDFSHVREFTLEMNPATVSLEKAKAMLTLGVNRVSMGAQSWDEELLTQVPQFGERRKYFPLVSRFQLGVAA